MRRHDWTFLKDHVCPQLSVVPEFPSFIDPFRNSLFERIVSLNRKRCFKWMSANGFPLAHFA